MEYSAGQHARVSPPISPQYIGRKTLPIKRSDAEPLTREDLQYDLLYYIFADRTTAFVDHLAPGKPLVNFCDLYVNALYNSSKCSKVLKDKMVETPAFAIEFAKISLLTNVGRINTTMAFFPEMKTALRTYHPVPSLQKTDGNLQDAPRIKNCLKASRLPFEFKVPPPSSPAEILEKVRSGQIPPTSVVNLIFVLSNSNHTLTIAQKHFDPPVDFTDLFLPINISSASRANVFLWLMFHYLQGPDKPNPWDDDYSRANPGKVPRMRTLTREEQQQENVDPPDEVEWGKRMSATRSKFLKELVDEMEMEKRRKKNPAPLPPPTASTSSLPLSAQDLAAFRRARPHRNPASTSDGSRGSSHSHDLQASTNPMPDLALRPQPFVTFQPDEDPNQDRSMLQHAWHVVTTTDPLDDSDQEANEHVRTDYNRRMRVLARLRGKEPTPEPEQATIMLYPPPPPPPSGGGEDGSTGRLQQVRSWQ
ncbi:Ino eighty subunit 1 [Grifola frondosa]|uniref:Ino eighty subunit 1 n=1 Tax=Grifola frondosa TaxID=5627 RepID=A0A1C7MRP5_GRIFR|nr:Ino eighty subunit 1 [Grifola frondosa]